MSPQAQEDPSYRIIQAIEEVFREHGFDLVESNDHDPIINAVKGCKQVRIGLKSLLVSQFTEKELRDILPYMLK